MKSHPFVDLLRKVTLDLYARTVYIEKCYESICRVRCVLPVMSGHLSTLRIQYGSKSIKRGMIGVDDEQAVKF